jgi:hypothetical protein
MEALPLPERRQKWKAVLSLVPLNKFYIRSSSFPFWEPGLCPWKGRERLKAAASQKEGRMLTREEAGATQVSSEPGCPQNWGARAGTPALPFLSLGRQPG